MGDFEDSTRGIGEQDTAIKLTQKYWDKLLAALGLSMKRGLTPRKLSYLGSSKDLVGQEERNFAKRTGKSSRPRKPEE